MALPLTFSHFRNKVMKKSKTLKQQQLIFLNHKKDNGRGAADSDEPTERAAPHCLMALVGFLACSNCLAFLFHSYHSHNAFW